MGVLLGGGFIDNGLGDRFALNEGKFRVPTLRNVELTAPYMHNGVFDTLEEVVEFYDSRLIANAEVITNADDPDVGGLALSVDQKADLVAFLKTLTDQ